ncbi:DNA-binding GntR family transcriptional regulator [Catenulispora sp. GAS73]|uniref:GntR family transcriptional regulator n=1 Tax=Catenulispora sp. GAS73 TaxID=3156269 RepID=UPI0035196598
MAIDLHISRTLYRQLADHLGSKIYNGDLKLGEQLPAERELMDQCDASRNTVRLALGQLANEQPTVSGRERFVRASATLLFMDYRRDRAMALGGSNRDHLRPAREQVASLLELEENESTAVRKGIRTLDGEPNSLSMSYYPMSIVATSEIIQLQDIELHAEKRPNAGSL